MKHLFQESKEHKMSSHGHMLVETTTIAYSIRKNYVWILSHYHELIKPRNGSLLHPTSNDERSKLGL